MKLLPFGAAVGLIAGCLTLSAAPASATPTYTVSKTFGGSVFGQPNWSENATVHLNDKKRRVRAGLFRVTLDDGVEAPFDIVTFCIEIIQNLRLPAVYEEQAFDAQTVTAVNTLWSNAFDSVQDDRSAAAFQFALWEITHDIGFDLNTGALTIGANAATVLMAQTWLTNIDQNIWQPDSQLTVSALVSSRSQDLVLTGFKPDPGPGGGQVSEPATGLLALTASAAMLWRVRRNREVTA